MMRQPLRRRPVPRDQAHYFNGLYVDGTGRHVDPTMIWGTEVDVSAADAFLREVNERSDVIVTRGHLLIQAVGRTMKRHPQFNRRVVRGRVYEFVELNVMVSVQNMARKQAEVHLLRGMERRRLLTIARSMWQFSRRQLEGSPLSGDKLRWVPRFIRRAAVRAYFRLDSWFRLPVIGRLGRTRRSPVLINYMGFHGAPPMVSYQPSVLGRDCCTLQITMGPAMSKPAADGDGTTTRSVAPIFVRADHRIVDAHELGRFVATLRKYMLNPARVNRNMLEELRAGGDPAPAEREVEQSRHQPV